MSSVVVSVGAVNGSSLIGQEKSVAVSGYGNIPFRIVGLMSDNLVSGGKAPVTFVSKYSIGQESGWEWGEDYPYSSSEFKIKVDEIYGLIDESVRSSIKEVAKSTCVAASSGSEEAEVVNCLTWAPSVMELEGKYVNNWPEEGVTYQYYSVNAPTSRVHPTWNNTSTGQTYGTRSSLDVTRFIVYSNTGTRDNMTKTLPAYRNYTPIGFCV